MRGVLTRGVAGPKRGGSVRVGAGVWAAAGRGIDGRGAGEGAVIPAALATRCCATGISGAARPASAVLSLSAAAGVIAPIISANDRPRMRRATCACRSMSNAAKTGAARFGFIV